MCAQQGALAHHLAVILGYEPSVGLKRTSPRHPAPPANEVTGDNDNMSRYLAQEHVAR